MHNRVLMPVSKAESTVRWFLLGIIPASLTSYVDIDFIYRVNGQ